MKTTKSHHRRFATAFTLVELLTVIGIIAILAALLTVVLSAAVTRGKVTKARTEMAELVSVISQYESVYGHFPTTNNVRGTVTLGGSVLTAAGFPRGATCANSEVVAILMNITETNITDVNQNSQKNTQHTVFLNPTRSGDAKSPGVGPDLVYRDPWGNPYVISMNLNQDDLCEDAFYKQPAVSSGGVKGLILQADRNYAFHGKIMIWSAGPDGKIDNSGGVRANEGANKDNVVSW